MKNIHKTVHNKERDTMEKRDLEKIVQDDLTIMNDLWGSL